MFVFVCVCVCVCVCVETSDNKEALFFFKFLTCRRPEAHRQDSGQRIRLSAECEAIWDARLCTCSLYRTALQTVGIDLSKAVRISAAVGATPSKELCKCVRVCLFCDQLKTLRWRPRDSDQGCVENVKKSLDWAVGKPSKARLPSFYHGACEASRGQSPS